MFRIRAKDTIALLQITTCHEKDCEEFEIWQIQGDHVPTPLCKGPPAGWTRVWGPGAVKGGNIESTYVLAPPLVIQKDAVASIYLVGKDKRGTANLYAICYGRCKVAIVFAVPGVLTLIFIYPPRLSKIPPSELKPVATRGVIGTNIKASAKCRSLGVSNILAMRYLFFS